MFKQYIPLEQAEMDLVNLVERNQLDQLKKIAINDAQKKILLFAAAKVGNIDVIEYLLPHPVDQKLLNECHAFPDVYGIYDYANRHIKDIVGDNFIGNHTNANALMVAIFFGQTKAAQLLINKGIDLKTLSGSPRGPKAIHIAAQYNRAEIVQALLDADKTLVNEIQHIPMTPLMEAADRGSLESLIVLVNNGASLGGDKYDAIRSAFDGGHADVIKYLAIDTDLIVDNKNKQWRVGLYAVREGDAELLRALLEKFPRLINEHDEYGKTLLHHVGDYIYIDTKSEVKNQRFEIEKLLLKKNYALSQQNDNRQHRPSFYAPRGKNRDLLKLCDIREKYIAKKSADYGEIKFLGITFRFSSKNKRSAAKHLIEATLNSDPTKLSTEDIRILKNSPEFRIIYKHLLPEMKMGGR